MIRPAALVLLLAGPALGQGMVQVPASGGTPTPDRGAAFVQVMRANGCVMTEDQADQILPAAGFGKDEIGAYLEPLLAGGHARLDDTIGALRLSDDLCAADAGGDAALFTAVSPLERDLAAVRRLSDATLRQNLGERIAADGCRVDLDERAGAIEMFAMLELSALGLMAPTGSPAHDEMARRIDQFLSNPGPLYTLGTDTLTLTDCKP